MPIDTTNRAYVIFYAAATSALFTAAIVTLHKATEARADRNAKVFVQKSIVELFAGPLQLGSMDDEAVIAAYDRHIERGETITDPESDEQFELIRAYGDKADPSTLVGYAFPIRGVGFWARIDGYLAVTPDGGRTLGVVFVSHSETPGLGGRITERQFRQPFFDGLAVGEPTTDGTYVSVGHGRPSAGDPLEGRHVDAITGATGTSTAVGKFINTRLAQFRRAMAAADANGAALKKE